MSVSQNRICSEPVQDERLMYAPHDSHLKAVCTTTKHDETVLLFCHLQCGGGPKITFADVCYDCIRSEAKAAVCADSFRDTRAAMREKLEEGMGQGMPEGNLYFVSKQW